MRPLKLTLTAFGPYPNEQIIDSSCLNGHNLFLITGATGSGKTMIFDGICYALYAKASSKERDSKKLRSHFAKEETITVVEMEFELGKKRYWIKRLPAQQKKRIRGEGYTRQEAGAEFWEDRC